MPRAAPPSPPAPPSRPPVIRRDAAAQKLATTTTPRGAAWCASRGAPPHLPLIPPPPPSATLTTTRCGVPEPPPPLVFPGFAHRRSWAPHCAGCVWACGGCEGGRESALPPAVLASQCVALAPLACAMGPVHTNTIISRVTVSERAREKERERKYIFIPGAAAPRRQLVMLVAADLH